MKFIDQLGRTIELEKPPQRIISLVPSQTELLYYLGLDEDVVGITKFCVHPHKWFRTKTRVGGTKQLHLDKIRELHPDLILANKEENVKEQIDELAKDFPVWVSDVNNLDDAVEMIHSVGELVNKKRSAENIIDEIQNNFSSLNADSSKLKACYLIWKDPYMTIGGDTFIHDMMLRAGFENIFSNEKRYPQITIKQLQIANCQLFLLSSEPFPYKQRHVDELQLQLPNTKIVLVDGEMFSWYGSRLLKAPAYFEQLHREITIS